MKIIVKKIGACSILDSNDRLTVKVCLETDRGEFEASVPSGISTGRGEAVAFEADKAVENIKKIIGPALEDREFSNQEEIDGFLNELDGTKDKSRLGANAILPVSLAGCRALAHGQKLPLYRYVAILFGIDPSAKIRLPQPSFNMIEGGKHAESGLKFQEFMAVPQKENFRENFEIGKNIYSRLKNILENKFGKVALSREGAFSPPLESAFSAIDLILEASRGEDVKIAIDAAGAKGESYQELIAKYPIMSIEDPFGEEDYENWASFMQNNGSEVLIIGDDLIATNTDRMKIAKEKNLCNAMIIKPNQIGTVTETIEAAKLATSFGWKIMVSNRAGETEDSFIADLAVGIGAEFIKSGAPFPKERMAKYERLAKIEKELKR